MVGRFESKSAAETERIGARLAAGLTAGDVVLVDGELGAGKTTFVRGACRRLGVQVPVTSPTFTIGQRYPAAVPVAHLDLYRLSSLAEEDPDLLSDYLGAGTIGFVEWAGEHAPELAAVARVAAAVHLEHAGADRRLIRVREGMLGAGRADRADRAGEPA